MVGTAPQGNSAAVMSPKMVSRSKSLNVLRPVA